MAAWVLPLVLLSVSMPASSGRLRLSNATMAAPRQQGNITGHVQKGAQSLMEVKLDPFKTKEEACDYCFSSYVKEGDSPAGPVAPFCTCWSFPEGGGHMMFCSTPASAARYVANKKGCMCKKRDMMALGKSTCNEIETADSSEE